MSLSQLRLNVYVLTIYWWDVSSLKVLTLKVTRLSTMLWMGKVRVLDFASLLIYLLNGKIKKSIKYT